MTLVVLSRPAKRQKPKFTKERRVSPRYRASLRVRYKTPVEEGVSWIRDISEGGARLFLNRTLKNIGVEDPLELEINLPDENQPIAVQGNIVWSDDNDGGFRFDNPAEGDIDRILQYFKTE